MKLWMFLGISFVYSSLSAQITFNKIVYPSYQPDYCYSVIEVDNGYVLCGGGPIQNLNNWDGIKLAKTDLNGNAVWKKEHGNVGEVWHTGNPGSMIQAQNGGYILSGSIWDSLTTQYDGALFKFNTNGDLLWKKKFGGNWEDRFWFCQQEDNGNIIIIGSTKSFGDGDGDIYVVKTDSIGNLIWEKTYGGNQEDIGSSVIIFSNTYILGAGSKSFGLENINNYLIKTDTSGNIIGTSTPVVENNSCGIQSMVMTTDSGFAMTSCADTLNNSNWLVHYIQKVDSSGDVIWRIYSKGIVNNTNNIRGIIKLDNESIVVYGEEMDFNIPRITGWIMKLDKNGYKKWERLITYKENQGQIFFNAKATTDGGIICTGIGFEDGYNASNFWLVKLDSLGCFNIDDCGIAVGINEILPQNATGIVVAYSNPFTTQTLISIKANSEEFANKEIRFQLFDVSGRVLQASSYTLNQYGYCEFYVERRYYPSGIYFYTVTTQKAVLGKGKLVAR